MPVKLNDGFVVITQEEYKLARATGVLWDFKELGRKVKEPFVFERYMVPVYEGEATRGKQIGSASLFYADNKVQALISFDYATPERLDLQLGVPVYVRALGHYYLNRGMAVDYVDVEALELDNHPKLGISPAYPIALLYEKETGK